MAFSIFRLGRQCLKYRYLTCRWMPLLRSPSELSCANITTCDPLPTIECDEMWSFVENKENKQWIWLALDTKTREIVGVYVGARSRESANCGNLYLLFIGAVFYTDFWEAYNTVIPKKRHKPVGKETGKTNHIERLNNTLRQRISRLVRKTLSFSKKLENHIGAIWYFVHYYNKCLSG